MARAQELPGIFGKGSKPVALSDFLGRQLGLDPGFVNEFAAGKTPGELIGTSIAGKLGQQSIFDQLGIGQRAQELTQTAQLPTGFGGRTASEDALLQEIIGLTGGGSAARGLGAPSLGALGSQLAPALTQLRQQDIQNIFSQGQLGVQQLGALTGAAGAGAQERFGNIQGLLSLAELSRPQFAGQSGGGTGGIGTLLAGLGGLGTGLADLFNV